MDYVGDLAAAQQDLARSHDMDQRRSHVLSALALAPPERVIEVGCGGGLLLRELARAVAPTGEALGIDVSREQVDAATRTCGDTPNARAELGSASELPTEDASFDASVSTQVLEYVDDVEAAVGELARVTRGGGRLLNVATAWDSLFVAGGDARLTAQIAGAWDRHAPHPNLPVQLPSLLRGAGFTSVVQTPLPLVNRAFNRSTWGFGIARLMAAFAASVVDLDEEDTTRWLTSLDEAAARDELFMSVTPIMTTASRCA